MHAHTTAPHRYQGEGGGGIGVSPYDSGKNPFDKTRGRAWVALDISKTVRDGKEKNIGPAACRRLSGTEYGGGERANNIIKMSHISSGSKALQSCSPRVPYAGGRVCVLVYFYIVLLILVLNA